MKSVYQEAEKVRMAEENEGCGEIQEIVLYAALPGDVEPRGTVLIACGPCCTGYSPSQERLLDAWGFYAKRMLSEGAVAFFERLWEMFPGDERLSGDLEGIIRFIREHINEYGWLDHRQRGEEHDPVMNCPIFGWRSPQFADGALPGIPEDVGEAEEAEVD
jgi:hypothetical protein